MKRLLPKGVTILELLVVLVIISILSTIAVGVYSNQIVRAKYAKARAEIRVLETAIAQYEVDTGDLPPSGSGSQLAPADINPGVPFAGSGYLTLALRSSLNGQPSDPISARWQGPYVDWDYNRLGNAAGEPITGAGNTATLPEISFLDPFGMPYQYIRSTDYLTLRGSELPSTNPFAASETWYNPSTFQIISFGANRTSLAHPLIGTESDDISNFRSAEQ